MGWLDACVVAMVRGAARRQCWWGCSSAELMAVAYGEGELVTDAARVRLDLVHGAPTSDSGDWSTYEPNTWCGE